MSSIGRGLSKSECNGTNTPFFRKQGNIKNWKITVKITPKGSCSVESIKQH